MQWDVWGGGGVEGSEREARPLKIGLTIKTYESPEVG
jgi:hypothetical protein